MLAKKLLPCQTLGSRNLQFHFGPGKLEQTPLRDPAVTRTFGSKSKPDHTSLGPNADGRFVQDRTRSLDQYFPKIRFGTRSTTAGIKIRSSVTNETAMESGATRVYNHRSDSADRANGVHGRAHGRREIPIVAAMMNTIPNSTGSPLSCWIRCRELGG